MAVCQWFEAALWNITLFPSKYPSPGRRAFASNGCRPLRFCVIMDLLACDMMARSVSITWVGRFWCRLAKELNIASPVMTPIFSNKRLRHKNYAEKLETPPDAMSWNAWNLSRHLTRYVACGSVVFEKIFEKRRWKRIFKFTGVVKKWLKFCCLSNHDQHAKCSLKMPQVSCEINRKNERITQNSQLGNILLNIFIHQRFPSVGVGKTRPSSRLIYTFQGYVKTKERKFGKGCWTRVWKEFLKIKKINKINAVYCNFSKTSS